MPGAFVFLLQLWWISRFTTQIHTYYYDDDDDMGIRYLDKLPPVHTLHTIHIPKQPNTYYKEGIPRDNDDDDDMVSRWRNMHIVFKKRSRSRGYWVIKLHSLNRMYLCLRSRISKHYIYD